MPPLAASLLTLFARALFPFVARIPVVPAVLSWGVVLLLAGGILLSAVAIIRLVRHERIHGRILAWLLLALAANLFCGHLILGLMRP
jgi:hypothetical protein